MLHVAHHADDFRFDIDDSDVDPLADGILIREVLARETFINHDHWRRMFVIVLSEEAPAVQWNSHHAQVVRLRQVKKRLLHFTLISPA